MKTPLMQTKQRSIRLRSIVAGVALLCAARLAFPGTPVFGQTVPGATPAGVWLPLIQKPVSTPTPTSTPTATATPSATATSRATVTPSATPSPTATSPANPQTPGPAAGEWSQFGYNAQRTSYQPQEISLPWRWKWVWNGSDAAGGIAAGKSGLPRDSQPVTGGGRVYVAAGVRGLFALDGGTGAVIWNKSPGGAINSTPAYDGSTGALFVVSDDGNLYKLDSATGANLGHVAGGGTSALPLPPAVVDGRVYFSMGTFVHSVDVATLAVKVVIQCRLAGGDTSRRIPVLTNTVVAASRDLFVHAIDAESGAQRWRVKPTDRTPATSSVIGSNQAELRHGWPVIAEGHGVVFIRYRLDWNTLWTWSPWPAENAQMRANLTGKPEQQALFALRLDTGATSFVPNVGNGGFGDGDYMPMGPLPTVRRLADGSEVAYVVMRGRCVPTLSYCDGRWDANLGEMVLDASTVPGYDAGYVRYMVSTFVPTDEMPFLSAAGNQVFAGHWEAGIAHEIVDRSNARGSSASPIATTNLPHIVSSQDKDDLCPGFSTSHYCAARLFNTRQWPGGFYIYWKQGPVYDQYWSGYASWVISKDLILFVATDGSVTALEHGTPAAMDAATAPGAAIPAEDTVSPVTTPSVVAAADAAAFAGRDVVVEGVLADVFNNGKAVYLGFRKPHRGFFLVRILRADWPNFPASPETLYAPGDYVEVSGRVTWYQGDPVIYVHRPDQIQFR